MRRYGIKVWFGPSDPPREHYEAQVIGPNEVKEASVLALEIGFHAEHSQVEATTRRSSVTSSLEERPVAPGSRKP